MLPSKLYRMKDLARVGVKNYPTLKRWQETQGFPIGRLLGINTRVWTEEELLTWWNSRPTDPPPENASAANSCSSRSDGGAIKASAGNESSSRHSESAPACQALPNGRGANE